jgi:hypothetical protein
MTRKVCWLLAVLLLFIGVGSAHADTIAFYPPVGNSGSSSATFGSIAVQGYYYNGSAWTTTGANIFGRNETNDHGIGICNPAEVTSCGTGSGGGDWNELSNAHNAELIRLTRPTGSSWVSVQLSSLDGNGYSSDPANAGYWERGQLLASATGVPGGSWTLICNFGAYGTGTCVNVGGTSVEPIFMIPTAYAGTPYLFFLPYDWRPGTSTNNDFLVMAATVPEPTTLGMLATGLFGLILVRRRK